MSDLGPRTARTLKLERGLWDAIAEQADTEGVNGTDVVRAALVAYLNRHGHKLSRPIPPRNRRGHGRRRDAA